MPQLKVNAASLNVRRTPSVSGAIIGSLTASTIVEQLDISNDEKWLKIQHGTLTGWASQRYLTPFVTPDPLAPLDQIIQIANSSAIATYNWKNRGIAPRGYTKGIALVYARVYCHFRDGNAYALEMAKANTGDRTRDAIAYYATKFQALGMDNDASDVNTLRHLFVLLMGLGMRESSGRWCEGRDRNASNTSSDTAEAGLFQTSWNANVSSSLLPELFNDYAARPEGFLDVFKEGVHCTPQDLENFGTGVGADFQRLSKECPAFAAEFAAVGLRNVRSHWGPINRREAELRPEAERMFLRVQQAVDSFDLCSVVE